MASGVARSINSQPRPGGSSGPPRQLDFPQHSSVRLGKRPGNTRNAPAGAIPFFVMLPICAFARLVDQFDSLVFRSVTGVLGSR